MTSSPIVEQAMGSVPLIQPQPYAPRTGTACQRRFLPHRCRLYQKSWRLQVFGLTVTTAACHSGEREGGVDQRCHGKYPAQKAGTSSMTPEGSGTAERRRMPPSPPAPPIAPISHQPNASGARSVLSARPAMSSEPVVWSTSKCEPSSGAKSSGGATAAENGEIWVICVFSSFLLSSARPKGEKAALPFLGAGRSNVVGTRRCAVHRTKQSAPRNGRAEKAGRLSVGLALRAW